MDGWKYASCYWVYGYDRSESKSVEQCIRPGQTDLSIKLYTVDVTDVTTERKTADNLLEKMCTVIEKVEREWKTKVIAFTTDASGESRKARQLLREKFPYMVTPDCYAHQVNIYYQLFCEDCNRLD